MVSIYWDTLIKYFFRDFRTLCMSLKFPDRKKIHILEEISLYSPVRSAFIASRENWAWLARYLWTSYFPSLNHQISKCAHILHLSLKLLRPWHQYPAVKKESKIMPIGKVVNAGSKALEQRHLTAIILVKHLSRAAMKLRYYRLNDSWPIKQEERLHAKTLLLLV